MIVPYTIIEREPGEDSYKATDFPCPEVFISVEFIKIIAIDFVVNLVKHPIKFALFWLFFECKDLCSNKLDKNHKGGSNSKKAELDIAEFVVGTLYIQTVLWLTPLFCPMFVWVVPIILYIMFHYTAIVVKHFYRPSTEGGAQSSEDDTSYLIFIFTNIVFIGAINTSYGYFLIQEV